MVVTWQVAVRLKQEETQQLMALHERRVMEKRMMQEERREQQYRNYEEAQRQAQKVASDQMARARARVDAARATLNEQEEAQRRTIEEKAKALALRKADQQRVQERRGHTSPCVWRWRAGGSLRACVAGQPAWVCGGAACMRVWSLFPLLTLSFAGRQEEM